jgi:hypothetical protein
MKEKTLTKSINGLPLKEGDPIKLVGKEPPNPSAGYIYEMRELLKKSNDKTYTITGFTSSGSVVVSSWCWDPRNIYKIPSEKDLPKEQEPVLFDEKNLVV